jgi:predicted membrane protein
MMNDAELEAVLKRMAAEHRPEIPSAGLIWFRSQIARKQLEKRRIERPLLVMRGLAAAISAVVLVALIVGNWGQVVDGRSWFVLPMLLLTVVGAIASGLVLLRSPAKR